MASLAGDLATLPAGLSKLRQAAQDGDGTAVWELAGRAADGRGLPRDLSLAAKLYEKLAGAGYAPAQYKYAGHYEKGAGLVRDLDKAKMWYGRAAEQGHARSMHNLAVIYAENPSATGKPDYASAASWFRQGAEYGVRDSQYNLAVLYARGLGLTQDLAQSYAWFAAAAAQGDEDAGKKRDDVATKLSPADLAAARSIAANFKPHRLDRAVNEPPVAKDAAGPMTLLGAPAPIAPALGQTARKGV
jgi:localization factor PodJL